MRTGHLKQRRVKTYVTYYVQLRDHLVLLFLPDHNFHDHLRTVTFFSLFTLLFIVKRNYTQTQRLWKNISGF